MRKLQQIWELGPWFFQSHSFTLVGTASTWHVESLSAMSVEEFLDHWQLENSLTDWNLNIWWMDVCYEQWLKGMPNRHLLCVKMLGHWSHPYNITSIWMSESSVINHFWTVTLHYRKDFVNNFVHKWTMLLVISSDCHFCDARKR